MGKPSCLSQHSHRNPWALRRNFRNWRGNDGGEKNCSFFPSFLMIPRYFGFGVGMSRLNSGDHRDGWRCAKTSDMTAQAWFTKSKDFLPCFLKLFESQTLTFAGTFWMLRAGKRKSRDEMAAQALTKVCLRSCERRRKLSTLNSCQSRFTSVHLVLWVFRDIWPSKKENPNVFWHATPCCPFMAPNYANSYLVPISFWSRSGCWPCLGYFIRSRFSGVHLIYSVLDKSGAWMSLPCSIKNAVAHVVPRSTSRAGWNPETEECKTFNVWICNLVVLETFLRDGLVVFKLSESNSPWQSWSWRLPPLTQPHFRHSWLLSTSPQNRQDYPMSGGTNKLIYEIH